MNSESVDNPLPSWPAFVVHGLDQARAVLALEHPVLLLSAPAAALAGGCGWWRALVDMAQAERPDVPMRDILDCGDAPGAAMAALRSGQRHLVLSPLVLGFTRVAAAAATVGAVVLPARPEALDWEDSRAAGARWAMRVAQHLRSGDSAGPLR